MYILPDQILVNPEKNSYQFCFLVQVRLLTTPTLLRAFPWIPYILGFLIPSINWFSPLPMKFLPSTLCLFAHMAPLSILRTRDYCACPREQIGNSKKIHDDFLWDRKLKLLKIMDLTKNTVWVLFNTPYYIANVQSGPISIFFLNFLI